MRLRVAAGICAVGVVAVSACSDVGEFGLGTPDEELSAEGGAGEPTPTTLIVDTDAGAGAATGAGGDTADEAESTELDPAGPAATDDTAGDDNGTNGADDSDDNPASDDDTTGDTDETNPGPTVTTSPRLVPVAEGDSGDDVVALQEELAELGFAPGVPDGSYGGRTVAAIEAFQMLVGLPQTGEADRATLDALADYQFDGMVLHAGDDSRAVEELQERLASGPFDPGPTDGEYGTRTVEAVWALEKLAGVPVDGDWGPLDEWALEQVLAGKVGHPEESHDQRWVEVDLSQQLVKVYDPGSTTPFLVSHASSGSGIPWSNENHSGSSITPLGDFEIYNRIAGWRESSLDIGRLYNPLYFNGGIAFHGSLSVPLHPASHGCIRLPMHIAEYLPAELPDSTPVHVLA